jgi:predicted transcriptional regulator
VKDKIISYLKQQEEPKSPIEIAKAIGIQNEEVIPNINELLKLHKIELVDDEMKSEKYAFKKKR